VRRPTSWEVSEWEGAVPEDILTGIGLLSLLSPSQIRSYSCGLRIMSYYIRFINIDPSQTVSAPSQKFSWYW